MSDAVREHYGRSEAQSVLARVTRIVDAMDPGPRDASSLAHLDQLHLRGIAATAELADLARIREGQRVLDAGSGLGGPARYLAADRGARVTGVDLTPDFVEAARFLSERSGLADRTTFVVGDLLALPLADASFDVVWTQHVVMNVRDRTRAYDEFRRVLAPGGIVAFYDVFAADGHPAPHYPVPWAESAATSFLLDERETGDAFVRAGFALGAWHDGTLAASDWLDRATPDPAERPGLASLVGPHFRDMTANFARNIREGRIRLLMGTCVATE